MPITSSPTEYFSHIFTTRKVVSALMQFFIDKIYVERYDENGNVHAYIKPPVQYSNRGRLMTIVRNSNDNKMGNSNATVNSILPRISVNVIDMSSKPEFQVNKNNRLCANTITNDSLARVLSPVTYSLEIEVSAWCYSMDDSYQIIEQVLPYFKPQYGIEVNILPGFDPEIINFDLTSITPESTDEYGAIDTRTFTTIFMFSCNINYYYFKQGVSGDKLVREIIQNYNLQKGEDYKLWTSLQLTEQTVNPPIDIPVDEMIFETTITDYE